MFGKTTWLVGAAAGYVLGARAGRDRYDQIVDQATKLWTSPKVQDTVSEAQEVVKEQASAVKEKAGSADAEQTTAPKPPAPASKRSAAAPKPGGATHG